MIIAIALIEIVEFLIWRSNNFFTSFQEKQLFEFIENIHAVIAMMKDSFAVNNEHVRDICKGLQLCFDETPFLV